MKRLALVPFLVVAIFAGSSLGQDKKPLAFSTDFYPLAVGNRWVYQGQDPREKITITCERMEPIKRRVPQKTGPERVETIESFLMQIVSGDKSLGEQMLVTEDGVYRYAAAGKEITPPLRILKLPPVKGDSWACQSTTEGVPLRGEFTLDQETVTLPGKGATPTWKVSSKGFTVGDHKMEANYWFAEGVGIVKQHVKVGKMDMQILLEDYRPAGASKAAPNLTIVPPPLELK
jgi:hypothetical protein